jgi:hypothetical protein
MGNHVHLPLWQKVDISLLEPVAHPLAMKKTIAQVNPQTFTMPVIIPKVK